jgi:hypothetical protein
MQATVDSGPSIPNVRVNYNVTNILIYDDSWPRARATWNIKH